MIRADKILVDDDEGRFILVIETEDGATLRIDIHGDVLEFYDRVRKEIGPYAHEAEQARAAVSSGATLDEYLGRRPVDDSGYALDDPKHPTYRDRMSGISDDRS